MSSGSSLLSRLGTPQSIANLSDDEDSRHLGGDEHQLLGSCISDPSGFDALVSSGRLPLGLYRAILLSPAACELVSKLPVTGTQPLRAAWKGLALAAERVAVNHGDLIPAALAVSYACVSAATSGKLSSYCGRTLESIVALANSMSEGKRWEDCYRTAVEQRGLADLAMLAMRLLQTFKGDISVALGVERYHSRGASAGGSTSRGAGPNETYAMKGFRRRPAKAKEALSGVAGAGDASPQPLVAPSSEQLLLERASDRAQFLPTALASQRRLLRLVFGSDVKSSPQALPRSGRMAMVLCRCMRQAIGAVPDGSNPSGAAGCDPAGSLYEAVSVEVAARVSALRALCRRFGDSAARGKGPPADVVGTTATIAAEAARMEYAGREKRFRNRSRGAKGAQLPGMAGAAPVGSSSAGPSGSLHAQEMPGGAGEQPGSVGYKKRGKGRRGKGRRKKLQAGAATGPGSDAAALGGAAGGRGPDRAGGHLAGDQGFAAIKCSQRVKLACEVLLSGKATAEDLSIAAGTSCPGAAMAVLDYRMARQAGDAAMEDLCRCCNSIAQSVAVAHAGGAARVADVEERRNLAKALDRCKLARARVCSARTRCVHACVYPDVEGRGREQDWSFESGPLLDASNGHQQSHIDVVRMVWVALASATGSWRLLPVVDGMPGAGPSIDDASIALLGAAEGSIPAACAGLAVAVMVRRAASACSHRVYLQGTGSAEAALMVARGEQPKDVPVSLCRLVPECVWRPVLEPLLNDTENSEVAEPLQASELVMRRGVRLVRWTLDALAIPLMLLDGAEAPSVREDVEAEREAAAAALAESQAEQAGVRGRADAEDASASAAAPKPVDPAGLRGFDFTPLQAPPIDAKPLCASERARAMAAAELSLSRWVDLCESEGTMEQQDEARDLRRLVAQCTAPGGWRSNGPGELRDFLYGRVPGGDALDGAGGADVGIEGAEAGGPVSAGGGIEGAEAGVPEAEAVASGGHSSAGGPLGGSDVFSDSEPMAGIMLPLPPLIPDPPSAAGLRSSKAIRMAIAYRYSGRS